MNQPHKIVFLYTELATYFLSCVQELRKKYNAEIHIVRYPVNKEAPFQFDFTGLTIYERNNYNNDELLNLIQEINPIIVSCSGWTDKGYLNVCKNLKRKNVSTVLAFDNQWRGDLKQIIATFISPFFLKRIFSHVWVSGERQKKYAKKLHFTESKIRTGMYSADQSTFDTIFHKYKDSKKEKFPHVFIYVGRYYEFKGIKDLWESFLKLKAETNNDWELWCLGTGNLDNEFPKHNDIKNFGFVQPKDLEEIISKAGVFVLPSFKEPWGVVVHEYAAAGFPLVCSDAVGAITTFLDKGVNGFVYESQNKKALKDSLKSMIQKSDSELIEMAEKSNQISKRITPEIWADTLISMIG